MVECLNMQRAHVWFVFVETTMQSPPLTLWRTWSSIRLCIHLDDSNQLILHTALDNKTTVADSSCHVPMSSCLWKFAERHCVCACMRACVRTCARVCVRACVFVCACVCCMLLYINCILNDRTGTRHLRHQCI